MTYRVAAQLKNKKGVKYRVAAQLKREIKYMMT